jgi:hypothetical protein
MVRMNLAAASLPPLDPYTDVEVRRKRTVADRGHVLVVGQIFRLTIDSEPGKELVAEPRVQPGITGIEIAIWQQQAVAAVEVGVT